MGSTPHPIHEPEILPPGAEYRPPMPQQEVRRPRPRWAVAPATYALVGINCLVFLLMVLNHVSPYNPSTDQLMPWGADSAGAVLIDGQWWRILTAMFVHAGVIHLATNMWCLWNLGLLAEPLVGSLGLVSAYLLTGAAGNLLSNLWNFFMYQSDWTQYHDTRVFPGGVGASGAVFGIAGVLIILLKSPRLPVPAFELKRLRRSVLYFAGVNLVIPFAVNFGAGAIHSGIRIDSTAHIGGFSCGLLFAVPMVPRLGSPRPIFRARLGAAVVLIVAVLVLFGFYLTKIAG